MEFLVENHENACKEIAIVSNASVAVIFPMLRSITFRLAFSMFMVLAAIRFPRPLSRLVRPAAMSAMKALERSTTPS